jgi:hypothetical protein
MEYNHYIGAEETIIMFTIVHYKAQMKMYTIQESP